MKTYLYKSVFMKIQCPNKLSLRDYSQPVFLSMNGAHCVSEFELGTMGALLRSLLSDLTSCVVSPGKQLEVAARGPPCV